MYRLAKNGAGRLWAGILRLNPISALRVALRSKIFLAAGAVALFLAVGFFVNVAMTLSVNGHLTPLQLDRTATIALERLDFVRSRGEDVALSDMRMSVYAGKATGIRVAEQAKLAVVESELGAFRALRLGDITLGKALDDLGLHPDDHKEALELLKRMGGQGVQFKDECEKKIEELRARQQAGLAKMEMAKIVELLRSKHSGNSAESPVEWKESFASRFWAASKKLSSAYWHGQYFSYPDGMQDYGKEKFAEEDFFYETNETIWDRISGVLMGCVIFLLVLAIAGLAGAMAFNMTVRPFMEYVEGNKEELLSEYEASKEKQLLSKMLPAGKAKKGKSASL